MSAIERGLYVAVGAADLAAEKVRELPAVKEIVERTSKIRQTSLIDQAREIEPKVRQQAKELQARGEEVVARIRKEAKEFGDQAKDFPAEARKQLSELPEKLQDLPKQLSDQLSDLPESARKQATELRDRIEKRFGRGELAKPASKTSAKAPATAAKASTGSKVS
jgi:heparin binding hemagglutinin HbhA